MLPASGRLRLRAIGRNTQRTSGLSRRGSGRVMSSLSDDLQDLAHDGEDGADLRIA